jgi:hypothetical protein
MPPRKYLSVLPVLPVRDRNFRWLAEEGAVLCENELRYFWSETRTSDGDRYYRRSLTGSTGRCLFWIWLSDLKPICFYISFWTWETWKISLGEVSYWDKTTPYIYTRGPWPIEFPSIQLSSKQINLLLLPLFSSLSASMLFIPWSMTKHDILSLSANLGQPGDVLALTGSLSGESFDGFFASLPEN